MALPKVEKDFNCFVGDLWEPFKDGDNPSYAQRFGSSTLTDFSVMPIKSSDAFDDVHSEQWVASPKVIETH
ncbi:hypothetical protein D3C85_1899340 [compost metagenome]